MRGTPQPLTAKANRAGIIPACAGNTVVPLPSGRRVGDHPRVCGEHNKGDYLGFFRAGSSPRVRGTPVGHSIGLNGIGIIPACAGNTDMLCELLGWDKDHPRVCGEHCGYLRDEVAPIGIIPACAGNTNASRFCAIALRDHPRVCGEHSRKYQFKIP